MTASHHRNEDKWNQYVLRQPIRLPDEGPNAMGRSHGLLQIGSVVDDVLRSLSFLFFRPSLPSFSEYVVPSSLNRPDLLPSFIFFGLARLHPWSFTGCAFISTFRSSTLLQAGFHRYLAVPNSHPFL